MRFPQTFIDDLKRQADIVRIVQDYVTLKKTGAPCVEKPFRVQQLLTVVERTIGKAHE